MKHLPDLREIALALAPLDRRGEIPLTLIDIELLMEALEMAASRREAQARFYWPRPCARRSDEQAASFRELRNRLLRAKSEFVASA